MSTSESNPHAAPDAHAHGHGEDPYHLAHHFDTPQQQQESGKLGMWVFLGTEILMFGGLFCAYSIYRANHPEVFEIAHVALDKRLGGINTVVLIASSLSMAWGVRCAQLNQRKGLILCLILTLLGGFGFLGIKSIEYRAKWEHHLWVGPSNEFHPLHEAIPGEEGTKTEEHADAANVKKSAEEAKPAEGEAKTQVAAAQPVLAPAVPASVPHYNSVAPAVGVAGLSPEYVKKLEGAQEVQEHHTGHVDASGLNNFEHQRVHIFFQIYFLMTGLHAIHVLIGMALIAWVLVRAIQGDFSSKFFAPVDLVGLYWHLVDLIWIFLFPLLYLIH